MPLFDYGCTACGHVEEVLQKRTDPAPATCPKCGAEGTMTKEMSLPSFQLKGGGWYKDLYASTPKSDSSAKSESGSSSSSSSSKGDAAS